MWLGDFLKSTCKIDGIKESLKVSKLQTGHCNMFICSERCSFSQLLVAYVVVDISYIPTSGLVVFLFFGYGFLE